MEAMPFLIRSAIGLLGEEAERAEEAFWDVVTSMEYSNRNAVNTVCTYVSYQIDLFPNTYSITYGSFLEKVFITFLPLFPQNSPVWLMLTVKKNQKNQQPSAIFSWDVLLFLKTAEESPSFLKQLPFNLMHKAGQTLKIWGMFKCLNPI